MLELFTFDLLPKFLAIHFRRAMTQSKGRARVKTIIISGNPNPNINLISSHDGDLGAWSFYREGGLIEISVPTPTPTSQIVQSMKQTDPRLAFAYDGGPFIPP
jgi:hypothetical protein